MSEETPRGPRILPEESETRPPARIDFGWEEAVAPIDLPKPRRRWSAMTLAASGVAVLLVGLSALDVANFVADQFARGAWLGWVTLAVAALGYGLIAWAFLRELRGLWSLHIVDRARQAFARRDYVAAREATLAWAARSASRIGAAAGVRAAQASVASRAAT